MAVSLVSTGVTFPDNSTQTTAATGFGFKNRIINGDMRIDQRNAGASVTPTTSNTYVLDRWSNYISQASKYSVQRNAGSVTPPAGFSNYLGVTSLSAYSVAASDYFFLVQNIEGFNTSDFAWGTANAQTVTLSFWVRSSLTGTFGGALKGASGTVYSYPFTYTISAANTWEQKTITVVGPTAGTWTSDNTSGIQVVLGLGAGSTYSGTAGAWVSNGNAYTATGATSVVGTNGATFYITGVQLEKGSTATSFDYRPYGTELQLCQRYYEKTSSGDYLIWSGDATSGQTYYFSGLFMVAKRTAATLTPTLGGASGFTSIGGAASETTWQVSANCNSTGARRYFYSTFTASAEL